MRSRHADHVKLAALDRMARGRDILDAGGVKGRQPRLGAHFTREVEIAGSRDGMNWQVLARWKKDRWPMRYFQYGNAFLPDGENRTNFLAATTIAVERDDLVTTLWEVESA